MSARDWHARWEAGRIGFHRSDTHPLLVQHWDVVAPSPDATVFVPLAGKSVDMTWLAERGHTVVGIELSRLAVESFFEEAGATPESGRHAGLDYLQHGGIRLYVGDLFAMTRAHLPDVAACYDRASLVALDAPRRRRYAAHLASLMPPGSATLLISVDYPQAEMNGPPFAVSGDEVVALFEPDFDIEQQAVVDVLADEPKFRERGVTAMYEVVWSLRRREARR